MNKVLCTALSAETGPHFDLLNKAGFVCDVVPRDISLRVEADFILQLQGYCAMIAGSEPITAKVLQACPELRVISRVGVGYDAVDLAECDKLGIVLATTPGCNHHAVAEHAIALLMSVARGLPSADHGVRNCNWTRTPLPRIQGSTLGLVGLGRIGQATATRGIGLGMKVIAFDPFASAEFATEHGIELVTLDELYARADYVSLHTPVTEETAGMINAASIAKMKNSAVLINTARGGLVDEADLCEVLTTGKLRAAGLDVFEVEPLPADSPLIGMRNVMLSDHIAGMDCESHEDTWEMGADTIIQLKNGGWPAERIQNLKGVTNWLWDRS